jgi:hypothetical protein
MTIEKAARFPSGWLVVVLLAGNGALWAVMFFGTLAHLQALAGGAAHSTSGRWATVMRKRGPFSPPPENFIPAG